MHQQKKSLAAALVLICGLSVSVFSQNYASSFTNNFSFGASTSKDSANIQRNLIPRNVAVTANVQISAKKVSQKGTTTAPVNMISSASVIIELISPPSDINDEKSSTVVTKTVSVGSSPKTITLAGSPTTRGCASLWTVKIRAADEADLAEYTISGNVVISYPPATFQYSVEDSGNINLDQNNWVDKEFIGNDPDEEGVAVITGEWYSRSDPQQPIKMRMDIINKSNGNIIGGSDGYPINETRTGTEYKKLKVSNQVFGGLSNLKLRITNIGSGAEAARMSISVRKIRTCGS